MLGNKAGKMGKVAFVAAAGANAGIAESLGATSRGNIQSDKALNLSGGGATKAQAATSNQLATVASAKAQLGRDEKSIRDGTQVLYQAEGTFHQACGEYGAGSPEANKAKSNLDAATQFINDHVADGLKQVVTAQATAALADNPALKSTAATMNTSFQQASTTAAHVIATGAAMLANPPPGPDKGTGVTASNIFGGYNPQVLVGSCVEIQIMKAMAKMDNVTNTVSQRQTSLEQGMENMQKKMNNNLSKQLAAENPILAKLASLGKQEASASQQSTGLLGTLGHLWMGASIAGVITMGAKDGAQGKNFGKDWGQQWEGYWCRFWILSRSCQRSG